MDNYQLVLLDGSAFLFRSYFSTLAQNLTNNEGFPTGAMFGVISAIKRLQTQHPQAKIICIFDAKGNNFRHTLYPEYKANRKAAEDDLIIQIEPLYEIIKTIDLPFLCVDNVEADDVIATLAQRAQVQKIKTLIASGDKDLMQLVDDNINQIDMKGNIYNAQSVVDKMGVSPQQIIDFLALTGDSADNIPGVPSVGPKTAAKWLNIYQNIAGVKANAGEIQGKVGEKLRESFDLLDLSYKLVSLKFDVDLPNNIFDLEPNPNVEKLSILYQKYNFNMWHKELGYVDRDPIITKKIDNIQEEIAPVTQIDEINNTDWLANYSQSLILTTGDFAKLLDRLKKTNNFVFDLETTSIDYLEAKIVGWVFLLDLESFYIPVGHDYLDAPQQLDFDFVLDSLKEVLQNNNIAKIGQNLKYDSHVLANYSIDLTNIVDDTMLLSYCLNSAATRHNMDDLSEFYLKHKTIHFEDVAGKGKKQIGFNQVSIDNAMAYACEDVIITHKLAQVLKGKIVKHPKLFKLYQKLEIPLIKILMKMERNGVMIDVKTLHSQQVLICEQIQKIKQQAFEITQESFNLDSPKQLQQILFSDEGLALAPRKKTPKGAPSTNEEALKLLEHPLVDCILSYRTLAKLNSTYLEALPKQISAKTKRLHTSYHQAAVLTGRLSSSNPNLQNIPIRTVEGSAIRRAFIAPSGFKIVAADYSQIELRIMAHISQDSALIEAFAQDKDIHKITASTVFNVGLNDVSKNQRRDAKAINFGLIYGMSAFGLAKQINTSRTIAKEYIEMYFNTYPGVAQYMNKIKQKAIDNGFVETIRGRRVYFPQLKSSNKMLKQHALRSAINAPMQGSSADIIKQAMLDIDNWITQETNKADIKMIMQVHDELVFEVKDEKVDDFSQKIQNLMQNVCQLSVPLKVDVGVGDSWQQAH